MHRMLAGSIQDLVSFQISLLPGTERILRCLPGSHSDALKWQMTTCYRCRSDQKEISSFMPAKLVVFDWDRNAHDWRDMCRTHLFCFDNYTHNPDSSTQTELIFTQQLFLKKLYCTDATGIHTRIARAMSKRLITRNAKGGVNILSGPL